MTTASVTFRQLEREAQRACGHLFVRIVEFGEPRFFWRVSCEISHQGDARELVRVAASRSAARGALLEVLRTLTPPPAEVSP